MAIQRRPRAARAGESPRAKHYRYGVKWLYGGGTDGAPQSVMVGDTKGHEAQAVALNAWLKSEGWRVTADDPRIAEQLGTSAPADDESDDEPAPTVGELVDAFIARPGKSERSRVRYRASRKALGVDMLGTRADKLTRRGVNAVFAAWESRGLAPKTMHGYRVVFKGALSLYRAADLADLFADTKRYSNPKRTSKVRVLNADQTRALLANAHHEGMTLPLLVMAHCGLRYGEMAGLTVGDIDFANGEIRIERQLPQARKRADGFTTEPVKWDSVRTVPMRPELADALALLRERPHDAPAFFPPYADWWLYDGWAKAWARTVARAPSVPAKTTTHDMRHTAAMRWLRGGAPLGVVQAALGHSKVTTTAELYSHWTDDDRAAILAAGAGLTG